MAQNGPKRSRARGARPPVQEPFYSLTTPNVEAIQERVVQNTRAAVRSLASSRPYTPADHSRTLFGTSQGYDAFGSPVSVSRPSSAVLIGRKQFLQHMPETVDSRPASVRGGRLAPIADSGEDAAVTPAVSGSLPKRRLPVPPANSRVRTFSAVSLLPRDVQPPRKPHPPDTKPSTLQPRPPGQPRPANRRSSSADKGRVSTAQLADSAFWDQITVMVADLNPEAELSTLCNACDDLYDAFATLQALPNPRKVAPVLRSIFRLLDMKEARLLLKLIRLVLILTDQTKTVINACKLLFKLSREEKHDKLFQELNMSATMIKVLQMGNREANTEALIYCCGAIKNLSFDVKEQRSLVCQGAVHALANLLSDIWSAAPESGTELANHTNHLLAQITAALRNLAVDSHHRKVFLDAAVIENLRPYLTSHMIETEVMLNISRILSKLTLHESCRVVLYQDSPDLMQALMNLIKKHASNLPLVVRLLFVLGNLTATDDSPRIQLYKASSHLQDLFDLLQRYCDTDEQASVPSADATVSNVNNTEEVLVKLIRVLANMSINPAFGPEIALSDSVLLLVDLLERKSVEQSQELVLNIIGAINNISFYRSEGNRILQQQELVTELVVGYLLNKNMDVVIETARVFGNFSQDAAIRELLKHNRADEIMVVLLGHDNPEVVFTVCGVLMNLMADENCRGILKSINGVGSLVEVMENHGWVDWQLCGMACKTLWNFSEGVADKYPSAEDCFGVQELELLLSVLNDLLDDSLLEESDHESWQIEFVPVASHLLCRIQARQAPRLEELPAAQFEGDHGGVAYE